MRSEHVIGGDTIGHFPLQAPKENLGVPQSKIYLSVVVSSNEEPYNKLLTMEGR